MRDAALYEMYLRDGIIIAMTSAEGKKKKKNFDLILFVALTKTLLQILQFAPVQNTGNPPPIFRIFKKEK